MYITMRLDEYRSLFLNPDYVRLYAIRRYDNYERCNMVLFRLVQTNQNFLIPYGYDNLYFEIYDPIYILFQHPTKRFTHEFIETFDTICSLSYLEFIQFATGGKVWPYNKPFVDMRDYATQFLRYTKNITMNDLFIQARMPSQSIQAYYVTIVIHRHGTGAAYLISRGRYQFVSGALNGKDPMQCGLIAHYQSHYANITLFRYGRKHYFKTCLEARSNVELRKVINSLNLCEAKKLDTYHAFQHITCSELIECTAIAMEATFKMLMRRKNLYTAVMNHIKSFL